ncbi:MAG: peptide deformylase [Spirochaetia bacterium]|jgi:peptide deformylase|nr:peptide deformylase [Spirochaetia bacterium]
MLDIITIGNEILTEKAALIADINDDIKSLVDEMIETLEKNSGIGLAAPQVAVKKRLFITKAPGENVRVFINPDIIQTSQEMELYEEGCLSIPGVWANVSRPSAVTIQAWGLDGKVFRLEADDILARVVQHELDHLNGILFPERLNEKQRERLLTLYEKKTRK